MNGFKGVLSNGAVALVFTILVVSSNATKPVKPAASVAVNKQKVEKSDKNLDALIEEQAQQMAMAAQPYGPAMYYAEPKAGDFYEMAEQQPQMEYPTMGNGIEEPTEEDVNAMLQQQGFGEDLANLEEESNFFELPASIGQTAGIAVDSHQNLVLFHRSSRVWDEWSFDKQNRFNKSLNVIPNATIAILDSRNGKVLGEHGRNRFFMPHGLSLDAEGCLWVTDVGSHQVMKLDHKTFEPVLTLGEKLVPGNDEKHFCKPTDVAVAKNGDFFVADGYCNSRVMKFNKKGEFLTSFGQPNSQTPPLNGEFFVPHSLSLIEDLNLLCVADRENERIQCFAAGLNDEGLRHHPRAFVPTGTFFTKAENIGRVFAIREKQHYLVGVTNHDEERQVDPQVFVMDMNTGRANTFAKGLENAHALALSDHGDIYVAQINPNQIVKFSVLDEL